MTLNTQNEGLKTAEEWARIKYKEALGMTEEHFIECVQRNAISHANTSAVELVEKLVYVLRLLVMVAAREWGEDDGAVLDGNKVLQEVTAWLAAQKGG